MNRFKKYSFLFVLFVLISVLFHTVVWHMISKKVLLVNDDLYNGDLGRISFKTDSIYPRPSYLVKEARNLPKKHILYKDLKPRETVDIITIGDSFANAATQGINPYFQDYIATYSNLKVLNVLPYFGNFIETIVIFDNSGLLDELKPKAILIESVERTSLLRFGVKLNFDLFMEKIKLVEKLKIQKNSYVMKDNMINFINNQNTTALLNNIEIKLKKYKKYDKLSMVKLNNDFFNVDDKNSLLFYNEDIDGINITSQKSIQSLNNNFNKLANKLKNKGIRLYFMPAVDKYNLYEPYIENNSYPKSQFFEILRGLPKEYELIDTKAILSQELKKGVKDLYYADDTHWSYKASEAIFKKVKFE
ncbi:hypothetical protein FJR48_02510 [Sulfurimonas lithotrophica]|uniref:AlgX/AlgJ SGNH hydrolase-like domain-containing protein n=1 Tax=Sulfurimonas lithotrophica TaxID=2590022 RepID=A0A5P8NZ22_9BACT|nr:hypothetical protein [Sulfurimonas lithotrophica]QFR48654.1 hypothetical protein FJR48_02510 [Sulfurimonas lithotrophica]